MAAPPPTTTIITTTPTSQSRLLLLLLLLLPTELRLLIIEDLIPIQRHRLYILPHLHVHNNHFFRTFASNRSYFGLLASCHQLHSEIASAIYERITFEFYIEGPVRPRAVAKYLGELEGLEVVRKGMERAVVKICAWQWVEFGPVEMEWVLEERVAGVLCAISKSDKLKTVRLEIQEDGQDEGKPVFEDLIARFRRVPPGAVKTSLQGGSVLYRAGQVVEEGTPPLVKSFELHELETIKKDPIPLTTAETKSPTRQRWVERGHLEG